MEFKILPLEEVHDLLGRVNYGAECSLPQFRTLTYSLIKKKKHELESLNGLMQHFMDCGRIRVDSDDEELIGAKRLFYRLNMRWISLRRDPSILSTESEREMIDAVSVLESITDTPRISSWIGLRFGEFYEDRFNKAHNPLDALKAFDIYSQNKGEGYNHFKAKTRITDKVLKQYPFKLCWINRSREAYRELWSAIPEWDETSAYSESLLFEGLTNWQVFGKSRNLDCLDVAVQRMIKLIRLPSINMETHFAYYIDTANLLVRAFEETGDFDIGRTALDVGLDVAEKTDNSRFDILTGDYARVRFLLDNLDPERKDKDLWDRVERLNPSIIRQKQ